MKVSVWVLVGGLLLTASCATPHLAGYCKQDHWRRVADDQIVVFRGRPISCAPINPAISLGYKELNDMGLCDDGCYCVYGAVVAGDGIHFAGLDPFCQKFPSPPTAWLDSHLELSKVTLQKKNKQEQRAAVGHCKDGVWHSAAGYALVCGDGPLRCISAGPMSIKNSKEELDALGVCGKTGKGCQCIDGGMFATIECQHLPMWDWLCDGSITK